MNSDQRPPHREIVLTIKLKLDVEINPKLPQEPLDPAPSRISQTTTPAAAPPPYKLTLPGPSDHN